MDNYIQQTIAVFPPWLTAHSWPGPPHYRGFTITDSPQSVGLLDEWSAWCRDLYLTTHNTHTKQTSGGIRTRNSSKLAAADPLP